MKRAVIVAALSAVVFVSQGQHSLEASLPGINRMEVAKSSINIPVWHERSFWALYDEYLVSHEPVAAESYRALTDMAKTDKHISDSEAFDNAQKMIAHRNEELALRARYFSEVGSGFNGIIALQFLQTEALLDMVESSQIYDATNWRYFRFHPKALSPAQFKTAKYNTISAALSLSPENSAAFFDVYVRYEEECDAILGADYSVYELFAGEASDYTPAIAKRLGNNLLSLMQREARLKEKYFSEMNAAVGSSLATRFLAWEDYYSLVSKMYAWAEN